MTARNTASAPKKAESLATRRSRATAASTESASGWKLNVKSRLTAVNAVATLRATELDSELERMLMRMVVWPAGRVPLTEQAGHTSSEAAHHARTGRRPHQQQHQQRFSSYYPFPQRSHRS